MLGYTVLNHTTVIHNLVIKNEADHFCIQELYLEGRISYAQLESLISCSDVPLHENRTPLAIPSITHLHCDLNWECLNRCDCFSKAATNLHSLGVHFDDCYFDNRCPVPSFDRLDALTNLES